MEGKEKPRNRLKGLFSKEKKITTESDDLDSFLRGPSDQLNCPAPAPNTDLLPRLTEIESNSARPWPTAATVVSATGARGRATTSPRRSRKGLAVRFTDHQPEIIGEGGEAAEDPTISVKKRSYSYPQEPRSVETQEPFRRDPTSGESFRPAQIRRTQTGYESISDDVRGKPPELGRSSGSNTTENACMDGISHRPNSFADRVKEADMRGEGKALLAQPSSVKETQQRESFEAPRDSVDSRLDELQINTLRNAHTNAKSPSDSIPTARHFHGQQPFSSQGSSFMTSHADSSISIDGHAQSMPTIVMEGPIPVSRSSSTKEVFDSPKPISKSSTFTLQEAAIAVGDEALREFSKRVTHLFTLFRLSSEAVQPLSKVTMENFMKSATWWFLSGRLSMEATIRARPTSLEAQNDNSLARQQAYANLAKSLWIIEQAIPEYYVVSPTQTTNSPDRIEMREMQQGIMVNLKKLAISMKRNDILPPKDAPLPQGLDPTIWIQDKGNSSLLASQRQSVVSTKDAMPLGDSTSNFHFARMFAKAILSEEAAAQYYQCTVLVSLGRDPREKSLSMIITNQSGTFRLRIQGDKTRGPTWEHVVWNGRSNCIDVKLPRGFMLRIECSYHDFKTFAGIHDYEMRIHLDMKPRQDEEVIFDSTVRALQHFGDPTFPQEPMPHSKLRAFEKVLVERGATGARKMHRGFRFAFVTHPSNKNLRGISQDLPPTAPTQFGFLRGEDGLPAFLLKVDDAKQKYTIVVTFDDANERSLLHARITGTSLCAGEAVVAEVSLESVTIQKSPTGASDCLTALPWNSIRIINEDQVDLQNTRCVLSENLRMVMDFGTGSLTDRVNVGPGELRIRLDVKSSNQMHVFRQPQFDMTSSVIEAQVSKSLPSALEELLNDMTKTETVRTYNFPSLKDLHLFQAALTGFPVIFDGMAASLNISRRRMVVPIYKKWEATNTRIQIVRREKVVQLVAFFENFSHGDCMNFTLKSTDVFETSGKNGKYSLRIVDAKFSLPTKSQGESNIGTGYVCLDMPEYPGEHDDITIVFDTEEEQRNFQKSLPGAVKVASRMSSVRR